MIMQEWFSITELLAMHHRLLPDNERSLYRFINQRMTEIGKKLWRERAGQGGGKEYHIDLLPMDVQAEIRAMAQIAATKVAAEEASEARRSALWDIYTAASPKAKEEAQRRAAAVRLVDDMLLNGLKGSAVAHVATQFGESTRTIRRWVSMCKGVGRHDWLAAVTPRHVGGVQTADCHPMAMEMLKSDWLRPEGPSFKSCYDRMVEAAKVNEWGAIPHEKTLLARIKKDVGAAAIIYMRDGRGAAERLVPSLTRTREHLYAMQSWNADGHVWDVAVKWEDGEIGRPVIVGFQDVYSGMPVSHRIGRTENQELVRLALADAVESWGIPEHVYFDNGRGFMSKWLTGRMKFRFRFKVKAEEPQGILEHLGVKVHAVRPYHGQSKPVERMWKDFEDRIAKHPRLAGAYMGNRPDAKPENYGSRAIPIEEFRQFVAVEVRRHCLQAGRSSHTAKGRSLWETFRESYQAPTTLVRRASEAQRQFFLMAAQGVTARSSNGELHLAGNRYWHEDLVAHRGRKLMVRFDPQSLHDDLHIYTLSGEPICIATCLAPEGFDTWAAAHEIERKRKAYLRALRQVADLHRTLTADEVADLVPDAPELPALTSSVTRIVTGNTIRKSQAEQDADADAFARGVAQMSGAVIGFPEKENLKGK